MLVVARVEGTAVDRVDGGPLARLRPAPDVNRTSHGSTPTISASRRVSAAESPGRRRLSVGMADDHPIYMVGLRRVLQLWNDVDVVWSVGTATQALRSMAKSPVDILLMDLVFADGANGLEATKTIRRRWPDTKVVIVSAHVDRDVVAAAKAAGVAGLVAKHSSPTEIESIIRQLVATGVAQYPAGRIPRSQTENVRVSTTQDSSALLKQLTRRELEVLEHIRRGLTNREIAVRLGVSATTVNKHVHRVLRKLQARNRAQAANFR